MMIHEITEKVGAHKRRKRVGRGPGSGHGKTSGRGTKGAGSRSGFGRMRRAGYEGGQMPFFRRFAKRGFSNAKFKTIYEVVNVKALDARFKDGDTVSAIELHKAGMISNASVAVKVLGEGEISKKLTVTAASFSESAREKITKAGGTCAEA